MEQEGSFCEQSQTCGKNQNRSLCKVPWSQGRLPSVQSGFGNSQGEFKFTKQTRKKRNSLGRGKKARRGVKTGRNLELWEVRLEREVEVRINRSTEAAQFKLYSLGCGSH